MKGVQVANRIADLVTLSTSVTIDFNRVSAQIRKKLHNIVRLRITVEGYNSKATHLADLFKGKITIYRNMMTLVWEHIDLDERETMVAKALLLDVKLPSPNQGYQWVYMNHVRGGLNVDWQQFEKNKRMVLSMFKKRAESIDIDPIDPAEAAFRQEIMHAIETKALLTFDINV